MSEVDNTSSTGAEPLLHVEDLAVRFHTGNGVTKAVNGVNLMIYPKQTLAVVGESGCGKSVSAMSTLQLIPTPPGHYERGRIWFNGRDMLQLDEKAMRDVRGNDIAMIFQEPMTSLNPVYTIGDQVMEAILLHQTKDKEEATRIAVKALSDVGIAEPGQRLKEYPHQLSGGMRQRVMIAMALACRPRLLLADEPTTALDVTIQAQILELLRKLQMDHDMSIMLITHDLGVVAENADVVAVMYAGQVVEYANVHEIFANPMHPYTHGLFESIPKLGGTHERLATVLDQTPDESVLPEGLTFKPTDDCPTEAFDHFPILSTLDRSEGNEMVQFLCDTAMRHPVLHEVKPGHWVACWHKDGFVKGETVYPRLEYRRATESAAV